MNSYLQVKKLLVLEKTEDLVKGWKPMHCKSKVQKIKAWLKNQRILSENQKKDLAQRKDNIPVEAPQASTSNNMPQRIPNKSKKTPKSNKKGKEKPKLNKPYPQNYRITKRKKIALDNVFNMERNLVELKNKEEERMNQYFPKK
ncbi:hypothetical protein O181_040426 [Austropuccinia psidii MF-1]|uniref:Uncharacterized protein n=1 Tax=Austropuccinia psidii MF-1 TaxID=1389203 RepID=A0A9Q3HDD6_9BASI|nr:hypothetical protein [Austropuccinia psidii MF-1]